jgi:hypothetical protein
MTHSPTELELSPDAAARLDDYLRQVRAALAGAADVTPGEIEADIREHVENELRGAPRPVPVGALEAVLTRLGPPSQWGAGDDPSLLRRAWHLIRARLRTAREAVWRGPEDWRLAYLSFGVFAVGVLTVVAFPVCLLVSYLLARAGVAAAREKGAELGAARKWLLYPPLVVVSTALTVVVVALPVAAGIAAGAEVAGAEHRVTTFDRPDPAPVDPRDRRAVRDWEYRQTWKTRVASQVEEDRQLLAVIPVSGRWAPAAAGLFVGVGACALWWTVVGLLAGSFPGAVRAAFVPFHDRFTRGRGYGIAAVCFFVLIVWSAWAFEIASAAGLTG